MYWINYANNDTLLLINYAILGPVHMCIKFVDFNFGTLLANWLFPFGDLDAHFAMGMGNY